MGTFFFGYVLAEVQFIIRGPTKNMWFNGPGWRVLRIHERDSSGYLTAVRGPLAPTWPLPENRSRRVWNPPPQRGGALWVGWGCAPKLFEEMPEMGGLHPRWRSPRSRKAFFFGFIRVSSPSLVRSIPPSFPLPLFFPAIEICIRFARLVPCPPDLLPARKKGRWVWSSRASCGFERSRFFFTEFPERVPSSGSRSFRGSASPAISAFLDLTRCYLGSVLCRGSAGFRVGSSSELVLESSRPEEGIILHPPAAAPPSPPPWLFRASRH